MNEEEKEYIEHEIVDRLYCLQEQDFDKTKVTNDYIQAVLNAGEENKKLVDKLQKELDKKDKVIDLMAQALEALKIAHLKKDNGFYRLKNKDELKEEFFKKVEEENE